MKKRENTGNKLFAITLIISSPLYAMIHHDKELESVLTASLVSHEAEIKARADKENLEMEKAMALSAKSAAADKINRARAAADSVAFDLSTIITRELTALNSALQEINPETFILKNEREQSLVYSALNALIKSIAQNAHALIGQGKKLDNPAVKELLASISKSIASKSFALAQKEHAAFNNFIDDMTKGNLVLPERSFETGTSQFALGDAGSACGAMTLVALGELRKAGNNLQRLQQQHALLDTILQKGKNAYTAIISQLKQKPGYSLEFGEMQDAEAFKEAGITWHDISSIQALSNTDIRRTLIDHVLKPLEDATRASGGAAAAGRNNHLAAYGVFTFSGETILLAYNARDNKWILFDSHRRDKYEGNGAAYHQFATKDELLKYLTNYPGLRPGIPVELTVYV